MIIEAAFGSVVVVGMPLRAWLRRVRAAPVRFDRYVIETVGLIGVLAWILWRRDIPLRALGLAIESYRDFALDLALCLLVVVGPDATARHIVARTSRVDGLPEPDPLVRDVLAGRHAVRSFVAAMVVGAIWEELCFRATLFLLVPQTPGGLLLGTAAGSLVFGAQHLRSGVRRASYACGYGVMFSVLYIATANLVAVMIAHAAGNLLSALRWTPHLERLRRQAAPTSSIFIG